MLCTMSSTIPSLRVGQPNQSNPIPSSVLNLKIIEE